MSALLQNQRQKRKSRVNRRFCEKADATKWTRTRSNGNEQAAAIKLQKQENFHVEKRM